MPPFSFLPCPHSFFDHPIVSMMCVCRVSPLFRITYTFCSFFVLAMCCLLFFVPFVFCVVMTDWRKSTSRWQSKGKTQWIESSLSHWRKCIHISQIKRERRKENDRLLLHNRCISSDISQFLLSLFLPLTHNTKMTLEMMMTLENVSWYSLCCDVTTEVSSSVKRERAFGRKVGMCSLFLPSCYCCWMWFLLECVWFIIVIL